MLLNPSPRVSESVHLGRDLVICISDESLSNASAVVLRTLMLLMRTGYSWTKHCRSPEDGTEGWTDKISQQCVPTFLIVPLSFVLQTEHRKEAPENWDHLGLPLTFVTIRILSFPSPSHFTDPLSLQHQGERDYDVDSCVRVINTSQFILAYIDLYWCCPYLFFRNSYLALLFFFFF